VANGKATGYDEKGQEIVTVPVTEPLIVREAFDSELGAARHNTP
jgi:hypothetical protein